MIVDDAVEELRQLDALDQDLARGIAEVEGPDAPAPEPPTVSIDALGPWNGPAPAHYNWHDGEKFYGGFGPTLIPIVDYWTLRARSSQLFRTNLYARGILRRLITNIINTGLHLEATPHEKLLGLEEEALADWSEDVETYWELWGSHAWLCDHREQETWGKQQQTTYLESLIDGDVLVVLRQDARTGLPRVQLISGNAVRTPIDAQPRRGHRIVHGVELDAQDRHVAYWVQQRDGTAKRLPAVGEKSGRRLAWLVYVTDKRHDDVRGEPLLSLILQSLREIDRYRDSTQRKAVINSMLAMFIKRTEDKMPSAITSKGAIRREAVTTQGPGGEPRTFQVAQQIPGLVLDVLQTGEEPTAFTPNGATDEFGVFETAIVAGVSWGLEIPPEILRLSFNSNYSASQAAINEFKMFLNRVRHDFGAAFCAPVYQEWLVSALLTGVIEAAGLLESWRNRSRQWVVYTSWVASDWAGQIKPAVDLSKLVRGYIEMINEGLITRDRASRELTGTKYSRNAKRLEIENQQIADARAPLGPQGPSAPPPPPPSDDEDDDEDDDETPVESRGGGSRGGPGGAVAFIAPRQKAKEAG